MREIGPTRAILNLVAALALLGVGGYGATLVARRHWQWQPTVRARAEFPRVGGLAAGDKVRLQGLDAGVVAAVEPPTAPGAPVTVVLRLDARLQPLLRADAVARIASQGVVGARVIEIDPGSPGAAPLPDGGTLRTEPPVELADLVQSARGTLGRLDAAVTQAEAGLAALGAIAGKVERGEGTLGKLVQDDEAYRRLLSLGERGEKAVVSLDDNLAAMKGLWPLSGYFRDRGFEDADRVLYRPEAAREVRTFAADELFEPGTARLTVAGRGRLDGFAHWFVGRRWPDATELVIAATADGPSDETRARILTTEQAEAVRDYLSAQHSLLRLGWFRSRKCATIGLGTRPLPPELTPAPAAEGTPARRVELVLFTPQG